MSNLTPHEEKQYGGSLSSNFIQEVANLVTQFDRFMNIESNGFALELQDGGVAVIHRDGWRAGFIKSCEDWHVFVPDYDELF